jgi:hypothetical protein
MMRLHPPPIDRNLADRFPRPARTLGAALLVTLWIGVIVLAGSGRSPRHVPASYRARAPRSGSDAHRATPFNAALQFANSYVTFLYGAAPAGTVAPVTPSLRRQLRRGRALVSPAERQRQVIVRGLQVLRWRGGAALADVRVDDGASPPYILSFRLRFRHGSWTVDRLGGSYGGDDFS